MTDKESTDKPKRRGRPKGSKNKVKKGMEKVEAFSLVTKHTIDKFFDLYKTGLYDVHTLCYRLSIDPDKFARLIETSEELNNRMKEAINVARDKSKEKLVDKALIALHQQIEGTEVLVERDYRVRNGNKELVGIREKLKGTNYNAVKDVLESFTDVFGSNLNPEKITQLFMAFNKFAINSYNLDPEQVNKIIDVQEGFINEIYLNNGGKRI
jgi:hypothetical protein